MSTKPEIIQVFILKSLSHCPHLFKGLNHLLSLAVNPISPLLSHVWEILIWRSHMAKYRCDRKTGRGSEQNSVKVFKWVCWHLGNLQKSLHIYFPLMSVFLKNISILGQMMYIKGIYKNQANLSCNNCAL